MNLNWLPSYIKWPIIIATFLIVAPISAYKKAQTFIHDEVQAYVVPMKEKRDIEIMSMKNELSEINDRTKRIETILMSK